MAHQPLSLRLVVVVVISMVVGIVIVIVIVMLSLSVSVSSSSHPPPPPHHHHHRHQAPNLSSAEHHPRHTISCSHIAPAKVDDGIALALLLVQTQQPTHPVRNEHDLHPFPPALCRALPKATLAPGQPPCTLALSVGPPCSRSAS
eukprot:443155-Rhodomonas_salina.1